MAEKERVKDYLVAFTAELVNSAAVKRGIEELEKGVKATAIKSKSFFEDIKKFLPDLSMFNKLLGLAGLSGVLSFGAIVSMMPQASRAFARAKQDMRMLAQVLGPVLEPAIEAISNAFSTFVFKLIDAEAKYGIIGKIAGAIKWVFDELVRIEEKYGVIDKLFGLAGAAFDFTIKVAEFLDDNLPDWAKTALEIGAIAVVLNMTLGVIPIVGGLAGLFSKLGLGLLSFLVTPAGIITAEMVITAAIVWDQSGKLKDNLNKLTDKYSYEDMSQVGGLTGVAGRAAWKFNKWTNEASLTEKMMSLNPIAAMYHGANFVKDETTRATGNMLGIKIIVDESGRFLGVEPDNGSTKVRLWG